MKWSLVPLLSALVTALPGFALSQDTPPSQAVTVEIDGTGKWRVPFRYWYGPDVVVNANAFAFLTEVTALGPKPVAPSPDHLETPEFRKGELKVLEFLSRGEHVPAKFAEVRMLDVEGTEGLKVGDRLIVLVNREPYEGSYVIDAHKGDCSLGILLSPSARAKLDPAEEQELLEFFRGPNFEYAKMTPAQKSLWQKLDPSGVAFVTGR